MAGINSRRIWPNVALFPVEMAESIMAQVEFPVLNLLDKHCDRTSMIRPCLSTNGKVTYA